MYTARRLGPPKFSKVRSEMHSQLLYSFGLCLFGAGCSIAPPPSLTKLAVIVSASESTLSRNFEARQFTLFISLLTCFLKKLQNMFECDWTCFNWLGHEWWGKWNGAPPLCNLAPQWCIPSAYLLHPNCSVNWSSWVTGSCRIASPTLMDLLRAWGSGAKKWATDSSVEIRARMSGTSLQLQPSSTLHFSGASFYMDFWLALIYIQICLRSTPFYRTMEDLSYISIYDYIYPLGGNKFQPVCGRGESKQKMNIFGHMMKHVFPVFQCVLHIRICSTHIVLTHQWSFSDTRMQEPPMRSSLFHFLQKLSRRSFGGIPQMWPQGMGVNSAAAMKGSRDVMGIMNNDIIRQLTTTGPAKTIKHMQDAVVMSSDESVELVSSNLM